MAKRKFPGRPTRKQLHDEFLADHKAVHDYLIERGGNGFLLNELKRLIRIGETIPFQLPYLQSIEKKLVGGYNSIFGKSQELRLLLLDTALRLEADDRERLDHVHLNTDDVITKPLTRKEFGAVYQRVADFTDSFGAAVDDCLEGRFMELMKLGEYVGKFSVYDSTPIYASAQSFHEARNFVSPRLDSLKKSVRRNIRFAAN